MAGRALSLRDRGILGFCRLGGSQNDGFLSGSPGEKTSSPRRDKFRLLLGKVASLFGISLEVEELCTRGVELCYDFPFSIARTGERQRVIGEKERGTRAGKKQGGSTISWRRGKAE